MNCTPASAHASRDVTYRLCDVAYGLRRSSLRDVTPFVPLCSRLWKGQTGVDLAIMVCSYAYLIRTLVVWGPASVPANARLVNYSTARRILLPSTALLPNTIVLRSTETGMPVQLRHARTGLACGTATL
eukprot:3279521-Rhodomonas_salina.1